MLYSDDEMLALSGIQHFMFCPRQWALIHIEQQWADNRLTAEGQIAHEHADDAEYRPKAGGAFVIRRMPLVSRTLGLAGFADIVEMKPAPEGENSIRIPGKDGFWTPAPVEYKHGKAKENPCDTMQLAAQAICIEEAYGIKVAKGAIYYCQTRHRLEVSIDDKLRDMAKAIAESMHSAFKRGLTPKAEDREECRSCSLLDICVPEAGGRQKASEYITHNLYEETA